MKAQAPSQFSCTRNCSKAFSSFVRPRIDHESASGSTKRVVRCFITAPERPQTRPSLQASAEPPQLQFQNTSVMDLDVPANGFDSIADALEALAAGELVLVLDDADRENEGDLIMAADKVTPEKIAFMVEYTSGAPLLSRVLTVAASSNTHVVYAIGVICVGLQGADCDRLRLPLMVSSAENEESMYTAFTVTVDVREGITTGISASDRAKTLAALGNPNTTADQLRKPGHIFPLRSREGGVLVRPGHTEAAIDLSYYAGCYPAGVLCEVVDKRTGEMARTEQLQVFAREHNLKCVTIADLVRYRLKREVLLQQTASVLLATRWGDFKAISFQSLIERQEHMALVHGNIKNGRPLVRIHQESVIGDVFGVEMCNAQPELDAAMRAIVEHGAGILIYLSRHTSNNTHILSSLRQLQALQDSCPVDDDLNRAPSAASDATWDLRDMGNIHSVLQGVRASSTITLVTDTDADVANLRAFGHDVEPLRLSTLL